MTTVLLMLIGVLIFAVLVLAVQMVTLVNRVEYLSQCVFSWYEPPPEDDPEPDDASESDDKVVDLISKKRAA